MHMKNVRDISIDLLRGWAILLMIISHSVFFRYNGTSEILNIIVNYANIFCYIAFLFSFGIGLYYSVIVPKWDMARKKRLQKRIMWIVGSYFLIAIVSMWSYFQLYLWSPTLLLKQAWRVVNLSYYPGFTEYLPSFFMFTAIFYLLRSLYPNKIALWFSDQKYGWVLSIGLLIHILGNYLSHLLSTTGGALRLIIGSPTTYDFPIMQYFLVVSVGIWTATWISEANQEKANARIILIGYFLLIVHLSLRFTFNFTRALSWIPVWINSSLRWPPSLSFILNGLADTFFFLIISRLLIIIPALRLLKEFIQYLGQRSMGFLIYHLLILFVLKIVGIPKFDMIEFGIFIILIPLSYKFAEMGLALIKISRYNTSNEKAT